MKYVLARPMMAGFARIVAWSATPMTCTLEFVCVKTLQPAIYSHHLGSPIAYRQRGIDQYEEVEVETSGT